MSRATVSEDYAITIPREVCERLNIRRGQTVSIISIGDVIEIVPDEAALAAKEAEAVRTRAEEAARTAIVARQVRDAVLEVLPDAEVILYGSRARGDMRPDSDYDFVVLTGEPVDYELERRVWDRTLDVEIATNTVASIAVHNRAAWNTSPFSATPFHDNVERDGVRI
jgi:AbrB family looped-hinge helix DNA binding protein